MVGSHHVTPTCRNNFCACVQGGKRQIQFLQQKFELYNLFRPKIYTIDLSQRTKNKPGVLKLSIVFGELGFADMFVVTRLWEAANIINDMCACVCQS